MEKAIKKYWPFFLLPTLAAFIIGFVWPFLWGIFLSFHKVHHHQQDDVRWAG